jgi:hypothetical protein
VGQRSKLQPGVVEQYEATNLQLSLGDDPVEPIVKRALEAAERGCSEQINNAASIRT